MVINHKHVIAASVVGMFVASVGAWWFLYEPPLESDRFYDAEAFPEFELMFDGVPLGSELQLQPHWVVVARSLPPDKFGSDAEFLCTVNFHPAREDTTGMGFVSLMQQPHDKPGSVFRLDAMQHGRRVDVTPPMPPRDDPRLQWCGVMYTEPAFEIYDYALADVVNKPLMLDVWMFPLDNDGEPLFAAGILILREEVTIVP
jgi:hypothetical protein